MLTGKQEVDLGKIRLDSIQGRAKIHQRWVDTYADDMDSGAEFPDVVLFFDGKHFWVGDGFHRIKARLKLGLPTIASVVKSGNKWKAFEFNIAQNALPRGIPLTSEDRRHAAGILLKNPNHNFKTDEAIAKLVGCTRGLVAGVRESLKDQGVRFPRKRISSKGKVVTVAGTGKGQGQSHKTPKHIDCPRCGGKGKIPNPEYKE